MLCRKVLQPINFVVSDDSAIKSGHKDFIDNNYDYSKLKFKKNELPTIFKLKQLTDEQKELVMSEENTKRRVDLIIRCSLIGVENFVIIEDGKTRNSGNIKFEDHPIAGKIVDHDWYHIELGLSFKHAVELFLAAERISEATVPLSTQSGAPVGQ